MIPAPANYIANDTFGRVTANGWGTADLGGPWTNISGTTANYKTENNKAVHSHTALGIMCNALASVSVHDVEILVKWSLPALPVGGNLTLWAQVRWQSNADYYRASVRVSPAGALALGYAVNIAGSGADTATQVTQSGITIAAGTQYYLRTRAVGANPTTLQSKVWQVGTAEPTGWQWTSTNSGPALQGDGAIALRSSPGTGMTVPYVVEFDDLQAWSLATPVAEGVNIPLTANWQTIIDANPAGTTYVVASGTHREQAVTPKAGDTFIGDNAIMSGARPLTTWTSAGSNRWYASGQTQQGERHATDQVSNTRDAYPEDLWVNNVRLTHQSSLAEVTAANHWFFDYDLDRIYVYGDPAGKTIETAVTPYAFGGADVENVTLQDLTIKRYANPTQRGVIYGTNNGYHPWPGLTVKNCLITENHAGGLMIGPGCLIEDCEISYNGQIGMVSDQPAIPSSEQSVIRRTKIHHNLALTYNWLFEGGGTKFKNIESMLFEDNECYNNAGPQAWWDISNRNCIIRNNEISNGDTVGIFYEISYGGTEITGNTITNIVASQKFAIDIANSGNTYLGAADIDISGNIISGCSGGVILRENKDRNDDPPGDLPDWELRNITVSNNSVTGADIGMAWYFENSGGTTELFTSRGISFSTNTYSDIDEFWHNEDLQTVEGQENWFGGKSTAWWKANVEPTAIGI